MKAQQDPNDRAAVMNREAEASIPVTEETMHQALPVHGYTPQNQDSINVVNHNKELEETILRVLDIMKEAPDEIDQRWLAIGRTHIEQAFMAINRAVFKPGRVTLPSDG